MRALAARLGRIASAGDVIALVGDLGAGKTVFVQGLAEGLGVPDEENVRSPTFSLVHVYQGGRLPLYHVDLYRLEHPEELVEIGLDDAYRDEAVVAVEWMDRFPHEAAPPEYLEVRIGIVSAEEREVTMIAHGPRAAALADRLTP